MGMFDSVKFKTPPQCDCGAPLKGWQTKDLGCDLIMYEEGDIIGKMVGQGPLNVHDVCCKRGCGRCWEAKAKILPGFVLGPIVSMVCTSRFRTEPVPGMPGSVYLVSGDGLVGESNEPKD